MYVLTLSHFDSSCPQNQLCVNMRLNSKDPIALNSNRYSVVKSTLDWTSSADSARLEEALSNLASACFCFASASLILKF